MMLETDRAPHARASFTRATHSSRPSTWSGPIRQPWCHRYLPTDPPKTFYFDRSLMVVTCAFSWFRWRFFSCLLTIGPLKAPPTLGRDQRSSSHSLSCAKLGVSSFGALAHLFAARGISRHCCRRLEKRAV